MPPGIATSGKSIVRPGTRGAAAVDEIRSVAMPDDSSALLAGEFFLLNRYEWLFYNHVGVFFTARDWKRAYVNSRWI
jgi:hypothetical protein